MAGRRPDGYHLLEAEMVTVDLADRLEIRPGDSLVVHEQGHAGGAMSVPGGETNLVCRALKAVGLRAAVDLYKRIPVGGGLGGGSADAAAILRWAACADVDIAAALGADVPFCLAGGRARVGGIGEVIETLEWSAVEARSYTLLTPPFGVGTEKVFRAFDSIGPRLERGRNDLEAAALVVEPRLSAYRDRLWEITGTRPVLAGSGSTWYVEGNHPGQDTVVVKPTKP